MAQVKVEQGWLAEEQMNTFQISLVLIPQASPSKMWGTGSSKIAPAFLSTFMLLLLALQGIAVDGIQVRVKQGLLAGEKVKAVTGKCYYSFKGIPYAKPPLDDLRFKAPQDPEPWDGVRSATSHGPVCPQVNLFTNEYTSGSEDCLFLNVYTPDLKPNRPIPVLVSIPGGGFKFGSGHVDFYGPDFLVSKDVIVVTLNYRLDALGFLNMGTREVPGNAAMKDQVAALKWVQNNIQYFGGDPNQVTVIGESAAAASVGYHMMSPMSKGLFHRAISMSGSPLADWTTSYKTEERAFILGRSLGLETNNKTELLTFLQSVPYYKLINTTCEVLASEIKTNVIFKMTPFPPVVERQYSQDNFLPDDPITILKSGNVNKVDVMFSYNNQEAVTALGLYQSYLLQRYKRYKELFVPSEILHNCTPNKILELADKIIKHFFVDKPVSFENIVQFIEYASSVSFIQATQRFFKKWPQVGNMYAFKFSSYSSRNNFGKQGAPYGITGAAHGDDFFYIYDPKALNMALMKNSTEYRLIQQLVTPLTNFVKYGNPTPDSSLGLIWPKFNTSTLAYMYIGNNLTVGYAPDEDDYRFWKSIYEEAGISF